MSEHPISDLMSATMQKIREMVDVNTIVGDPIIAADGTTLIPISKVSFGFVSGGSDFGKAPAGEPSGGKLKFGGGSGAGVNINPVAFVVVSGGNIKLLNIGAPPTTTIDRVVEMVPDLLDKISAYFKKDGNE